MTLSSLAACLFAHLTLHVCAGQSLDLTFLHTNDVHSRIEQMNAYGGACSAADAAAGKCYGGVARRLSLVQELRRNYSNVLLMDAGDEFQGTAWYNMYMGNATRYFMNRLGYDAMTFGNHEFDSKIAGIIPFLQSIQFPVVSTNINASREPAMQGLFNKSLVLTVGGQRIGVVGYTITTTTYISTPGNLIFEDEVASVRAEVRQLEALGVNKIIALGHAGIMKDQEIARKVEGIDVVIGGHSHTFLYTGAQPSNDKPYGPYPIVVTKPSGRKALVVSSGFYGKYLGVLHVTFDSQGNITGWRGNPVLLDSSIAEDNATLAEVYSWGRPLQALMTQYVATAAVQLFMRRDVCRQQECNMGNLVADAMLDAFHNDPSITQWDNVTIAVWNSGSIRTTISKGPFTLGDVQTVMPFRNTLDVVEMTGKYVIEMVRHSLKQLDHGGFLQVSGLRIVFNRNLPEKDQVVSVSVLCLQCQNAGYRPIVPEKSYLVATNDFLLGGGDGFTVLRDSPVRKYYIGILGRDVLAAFAKKNSPVIAYTQQRIVFDHTPPPPNATSTTPPPPNATSSSTQPPPAANSSSTPPPPAANSSSTPPPPAATPSSTPPPGSLPPCNPVSAAPGPRGPGLVFIIHLVFCAMFI